MRELDDSITATLTQVTTPDVGELQLVTSDRAIEPDETCFESGTLLPGPPYVPGAADLYILDAASSTRDQLAAFAVVHPTGAEDGCFVELVSFANLDWG